MRRAASDGCLRELPHLVAAGEGNALPSPPRRMTPQVIALIALYCLHWYWFKILVKLIIKGIKG